MTQLVTRIPDALAVQLDEMIAAGVVATRSEAVRLGLERLIDRHRRDQVGAAIVAGYQAHPQSEDEWGGSDARAIEMIAEEPW